MDARFQIDKLRFHDLETASKTIRFWSVYTAWILPFLLTKKNFPFTVFSKQVYLTFDDT